MRERGRHKHIAAVTSIDARRAAAGDEFLTPEGHASIAAVAGLDANFSFIDEHERPGNWELGSGIRKEIRAFSEAGEIEFKLPSSQFTGRGLRIPHNFTFRQLTPSRNVHLLWKLVSALILLLDSGDRAGDRVPICLFRTLRAGRLRHRLVYPYPPQEWAGVEANFFHGLPRAWGLDGGDKGQLD